MLVKDLFTNPDFKLYLEEYLPEMGEEANARHRDLDGINQNVGEDRESILKCIINAFAGFRLIEKIGKKGSKGVDWNNTTTDEKILVKTLTGVHLPAVKITWASGKENHIQTRKKFTPTEMVILWKSENKATLFYVPVAAQKYAISKNGKKKSLRGGKKDNKGTKISASTMKLMMRHKSVLRVDIRWATPAVPLQRDDFWEAKRIEIEKGRTRQPDACIASSLSAAFKWSRGELNPCP